PFHLVEACRLVVERRIAPCEWMTGGRFERTFLDAHRLVSRCPGRWVPGLAAMQRAKGPATGRGEAPPAARRSCRRREAPQSFKVSSALANLLACERSALASVSNQSAISSKPSSRATLAMPGYMSVYSCVS